MYSSRHFESLGNWEVMKFLLYCSLLNASPMCERLDTLQYSVITDNAAVDNLISMFSWNLVVCPEGKFLEVHMSKTNIACHVKWYEIQVSLSIRKTLLEHEKNLLWYVIQVSFSINKSLLEHEKNLFFILFICILLLLQRRQWHPTPVLLPGKSHGQRSLVGCSPWGGKESDVT